MDGSRTGGQISGAILAGGRARRFHGVNKAALQVARERFIDRQLSVLRAVTTEQFVIANDRSALSLVDAPIVADLVQGIGPLGGVITALKTARSPRCLILACDLPFISIDFLRFLVDLAPEADAVVPRTAEGLHPLCAVYAVKTMSVAEDQAARERLALHDLIDRLDACIVGPELIATYDRDGRLLANINTPEEYHATCFGPNRS